MANPMPAAEVDVSAGLVRRLLAGQHPDLAGEPVEFLANGWDNVMFRVGEELVARLPRRALGAQILAHEQRWLPLLAPRLPLPIPYPERIGHPAHGYPWAWSIVPYLPGEPAATAAGLDLPAAAGAVAGPPVWLHGDLHPANILVRGGRVTGIIDFGDITAGDPAADLSVAWMLLPADLNGAFREAYQAHQAAGSVPADGELWRRARGWALNLALAFLAHSA